MKARIAYRSEIVYYVEVEVPDYTPAEDRDEVARSLADAYLEENGMEELCYHCSNNFDVGEFEVDSSDMGVWYP